MPAHPPGRHQSRPRRRGFTLVELLVVVGIIAVLVGLTVTIIPKVLKAAHGAQTSAQMTAMATAIQAYYNDFRAYPGPLPNNQVGATYYSTPVTPVVLDPNNANNPVSLTFLKCDTSITNAQIQVTGAENLVLGLLGGLELTYSGGSVGSTITAFQYNPADLFPDGTTPAPLGPMVLNPNAPKRLNAYLQVKVNDLSNSKTAAGLPTSFTDSGGRVALDSPIPEFLDKFSNPMPILYLRANVGGQAVVSFGGQDGVRSGNALTQTNADKSTSPVVAQYDLSQSLGYTQTPSTGSAIGTVPGDLARGHHGLLGLGGIGSAYTVMGLSPNQSGGPTQFYNAGANALAYFQDPNNPGTSNTPDLTQSPAAYGHARQKDAFILISPGPDGIYGTADDIIYPGGSVSQ